MNLVARGANIEGAGEITVRQLVRQALRMRPDRIVVGEVRGAEAADPFTALEHRPRRRSGHRARQQHRGDPGSAGGPGALGGLDRPHCMPTRAAVRVPLHVARDQEGQRRLTEVSVLDRGGPDNTCHVVPAWRAGEGSARAWRRCVHFCGTVWYDRNTLRRNSSGAVPADASGSRTPGPGVPRVRRRRVPVFCAAASPAVVAVVPPARCHHPVGGGRRRHRPAWVLAARRRRVSGEAEVPSARWTCSSVSPGIGAHPVAAVEAAARESARAGGHRTVGIAARARLGGDTVSGLSAGIPGSLLCAEWSRLAAAWRLAAEHGIPIGAVMRSAQTDIVERQRFRQKVQSALAGARASAGILATPCRWPGSPSVRRSARIPSDSLIGGGVGGWCLLAGVLLLAAGCSGPIGSSIGSARERGGARTRVGGAAGGAVGRGADAWRNGSPEAAHGGRKRAAGDPFATASAPDIFATCLSAGMAPGHGRTRDGPSAPAELAVLLRRSADLLALGAEPPSPGPNPCPSERSTAVSPLCVVRLARRSASSGTALADGVAELAIETRQRIAHDAAAAGERPGC